MVTDSITFEASKKRNLLIHRNNGPIVSDMTDLLSQTTAYRSFYAARLPPEGYDYRDGTYNETTTHPHVILIRGSPVDNTANNLSTKTFPTNGGIVGTVLTAYNLHENLQFSPDDLWISILAQFSAYVNGRSEELRSKIVSHSGQKPLEVVAPGNIYTADFASMTREFLDKIASNIKDASLLDWFLPGFSTSTDTDEVCASAMAMCGFQAYFTYKFTLICGVPQITLLGTVQDWERLRGKVDRLLEFDGQDQLLSTEWVPRLQRMLDEFVLSAKGSPNIEFWDTIVSHTGFGCGGVDYITGWITTLSMFDEHGQLYAQVEADHWPVLGINDIYHNVANCPATIDDNGTPYNATLFVGQFAYDYQNLETIQAGSDLPQSLDPQGNVGKMRHILKPRNDWALAIEEGFLELPPRDPYEPEPSDGTVTYQYNDECQAYESWGSWEIAPAPFTDTGVTPFPTTTSPTTTSPMTTYPPATASPMTTYPPETTSPETTSPETTSPETTSPMTTYPPATASPTIASTPLSSTSSVEDRSSTAQVDAAWIAPVAVVGFLLLAVVSALLVRRHKQFHRQQDPSKTAFMMADSDHSSPKESHPDAAADPTQNDESAV